MTEKDNPNFVERFTVRMPDGMRDAIAERAKANGRSMNSEIVQIIEDALSVDRAYAELKGKTYAHADTKGVHIFSDSESLVKMIEKQTDDFKRGLIEMVTKKNKKPT
ncbi:MULTISPECIES: Arc family DNA-binding protein [Klebsiella pneumoniae complex]|uniref:Arc family DNA-binding protein n=1 Tax=Klebsiella pneumoniae complex TaxID=3390273 RepID=UPI00190E6201|nr:MULTISPECIES: Arc family DNA-binding protein [Klebsiella]MCZ9597494.1 Arc family DNA-binding protein [Klebsiella quasipneumoniae]